MEIINGAGESFHSVMTQIKKEAYHLNMPIVVGHVADEPLVVLSLPLFNELVSDKDKIIPEKLMADVDEQLEQAKELLTMEGGEDESTRH